MHNENNCTEIINGSVSFTGFPNFDDLFDINIGFSLPDIDFGFDFYVWLEFSSVNFNCATQVGTLCETLSGSISADCSASLTGYWPGSGRRRRSITVDQDNRRYDFFNLMADWKTAIPNPLQLTFNTIKGMCYLWNGL